MNCSALCRSAQEARSATKGDIDLAFCNRCAMIFNSGFDANLLDYSLNYDNSLAHSPTFQKFASTLIRHLMTRYELYGRDVVEIGCGDGTFLDALCQLGGNRGIGYDPSAEARTTPGGARIQALRFTSENAETSADFVYCRHVLEHIEAPRPFLDNVRNALAARSGGTYFEVPDGCAVLNGPSTWDLIYPHCSYFTAPSLRYLFDAAGFRVDNVERIYGNQFLGIEGTVKTRAFPYNPEAKAVSTVERMAKRFDSTFRENVYSWSRLIEYARVEGTKIALWGAGAKSVTFLNVIPGAERVEVVVDLNPRKHGTFIPGTGQPVVPPESLVEFRPDIVILLNPNYEAEVRQQLDDMGVPAAVLLEAKLPLPAIAAKRKAAFKA